MVSTADKSTEAFRDTETPSSLNAIMEATGVLSFSESEFGMAVDGATSTAEFIGRGDSTEFLSEVSRWRRFFTPSALYGHRLGAGVSILSRYPFSEHDDLLLADQSRVTPNSLPVEESRERIRQARSNSIRIIGFFGGSTIQGYGARLPTFTIPALVEKILSIRYGISAVCLNYGVAGWTCVESLHLLIHEASDAIDTAVFYDGWNDSNDLFLREKISRKRTENCNYPQVLQGTSMHHVVQDFIGCLRLRPWHLTLRSIRLVVNQLFTLLARCTGSATIRKNLDKLLKNRFSLVESRLLNESLDSLSISDEEEANILLRAIDEYNQTHEKISRWCQSSRIRKIRVFQPLLMNSTKVLSPREEHYRQTGLPWGRPHISMRFRETVCKKTDVTDFSDIFDTINEEVFVDSGHLNMKGNFYVALRLAEMLAIDIGSNHS